MPITTEQAIYNRLASAPTFHPANAELLLNDWALEPGDVVTIKSGDQNYSLPIYSLNLNWMGSNLSGPGNSNSTRISIESTGHKEREPLPELRRKQFEQGRYAYTGFKAQQQEIDEHWKHVTTVTDQGMSDAFGIIGVSIGADGQPVKDANGNYVWDNSGTGGEIWGHLNRNAWETQILNHIKDSNGNIISLAEVYTEAYGQAIINAINDQRTGTAAINANRIKLSATDTITLDALLSVEANTQYLQVTGDLYVGDTLWATDVSANSSIHSEITIDAPTIEGGNGRFTNLYCKSTLDQYGELTGGEDVSTAYKALQFIPDPNNSGHFILQGKTLANPNTWADTDANFNIAATQFYIDTLAAFSTALGDAGWSGNHATLIGATLDTTNKRLTVNSAVANVQLPGQSSATQYSIGLGNLDLTTPLTNYYNAAEQAGYDRAVGQLTTLTATANGVYTPSSPSIGYSSVEVDVAASITDPQSQIQLYVDNTTPSSGEPGGTRIYSNTTLSSGWWQFHITVLGATKYYKFHI